MRENDTGPALRAIPVPGLVSVATLLAVFAAAGIGVLAADARPGGPAPAAGSHPSVLGVSRGPVRYVAPSGSDSNPGTRLRPWRTVQRALDALRPGEKALVRAGTYRENLSITRSGTRLKPITLRSYPRERVVLQPDPSDPSYPLLIKTGAAYFRVQGFVIEGASASNTVNVYVTGRAHDVEVSYCEVRGAQHGSGFFVDNTPSHVNVLANTVHDNNEPGRQHHGIYYEASDGIIANNVVYGHTYGFGIQVRSDAPAGPRDVVVTNNTVTGNRLGGIVVEHTASAIRVVNNISAFNQGAGVRGYFSREDHAEDPVGTGNAVHNNLFFGNGGYGNMRSDPVTSGPSAGARILHFGRGNAVANPRFTSQARKDFHLRRGSPALGRALSLYVPSRDRGGRLRRNRSTLDLGAYER